jgi:hypothetical protein
MLLFKFFMVSGMIAMGTLAVEAAEMEMKMVDKNCWIEVFDDTKYDDKDPHLTLQGPKDYATLKDLQGKDWNNDIESVIVGPGATVRAYNERDFKGTEIVFASGQRIPKLSKLDMSNDIESMKIACEISPPTTAQITGQGTDRTTGDASDRTGQPGDSRSSDQINAPTGSITTTTTTTTTPTK